MVQFYARHDTVYSGDSIVAIPFSYIKKEHIKVYINDNEIKNYTFLNATQIQIDETLTINDIISVRRITPIDDKIVTYQNMSMVLNEDNLNLSQNQSINAIQELYDNNTQFEIDTTETIEANKQELIGIIADDKEEMLGIIDTNKTELENAQTEFETEINNTLDVVISAAEKLETLDESVERAENAAVAAEQSANTATAEANEAASKAEEATEQAQLATQKAQEAADKVVEIDGKLVTKANVDLSNLTEKGNIKLQCNPFCVNSGPMENGVETVLTLNENIITAHSPFVVTSADGVTREINQDINLDVSELAEGTYQILFNFETNLLEAFSGSIYTDKKFPDDAQVGDMLFDISVLPYTSKVKTEDGYNLKQYALMGQYDCISGG